MSKMSDKAIPEQQEQDEPIWYLPYASEKECWLAAMSDLYDGKPVEVWDGLCWLNAYTIDEAMEHHPHSQQQLRPIHKHRAVMDLWREGGQKWQGFTNNRWTDCKLNDELWTVPNFKSKDVKLWRPHIDHEPELFKKYLKICHT